MDRILFNIAFTVGRRSLTFQAWCLNADDARDYFQRRIVRDWTGKHEPVLVAVEAVDGAPAQTTDDGPARFIGHDDEGLAVYRGVVGL